VVFYIKSEKDPYYFSLAIWNSITKEYPKNYAYAIRKNGICHIIYMYYATKTKYVYELIYYDDPSFQQYKPSI